MEKKTELVLEESRNPHTIHGNIELVEKLNDLNGMVIKVADNGIVLHGEHGVIVTESENVIKLTQQEFNPVSQLLQNAFD